MTSTLPTGTIRVRGVEKSFRAYHAGSLKETTLRVLRGLPLTSRRQVLKGIDLAVAPGERLGIVGQNGAGKSTLFRIISGILRADRGEVTVVGRISPLIEVNAGYVADMTGGENIRLNALLLGLSRAELNERFDAIVQFAGLQEFIETPLRYYSSGMQARLGFAVAVHVDADVLLIDEVLAVGDQEFQSRCHEQLAKLAAQGITTVLVSHDFNAVRSFCDRVVWIDGGVVRMDGAPDVVLSAAKAAALASASSLPSTS